MDVAAIPTLPVSCPPGTVRFPATSDLGTSGFSCTVELPNEVDLEQLTIDARMTWRIRKRMNAFLRASFFDRDSEGSRLNSHDRFRFAAGVRYFYDQDL